MLSLVSTITSCVSISAFVSLVCVPVAITSSAVGIKICAITAGTRKYKSIIKKKKKKHDKIAFLGKDKLNTIEILISKVLIDAYFRHDEFVSIINVLREYNKIKEEIKTSVKYTIQKQWKPIVSVVRKIPRIEIQVLGTLNKID